MAELIEKIIPLRRTKKLQRAKLLNDIVPGILIAFGGISLLQSGIHSLVVFANILAGGLLIAFGIKEWREEKEEENRFNWVDILGGVVLFLDSIAMYKQGKGFQPATLYFVASAFIVLKGFFPSLGLQRRKLTITNVGFKIRASFFSLKCRWDEIQTLSTEHSSIIISLKDGNSKSFKLRRTENVSEILEALKDSAKNNGIQVNDV